MAEKALITGSSSGIGRAAAVALAKDGYDIAVNCSKSVEKAEEVAHIVEGLGRRAIVVRADVGDLSQQSAMFDRIFREFGPIDVLVNNAGITKFRPFLEVTEEFFSDILNTNFKSHYFATQHAAKNMIANGIKGRVIMTTSVHQETLLPEASIYGSFKAALKKFVRHAALELAPHGIRVNAVAPGFIKVNDNPLTDRERQFISRNPLGREGRAQDIAGAISFLASERSSYITGADIMIDGGMLLPCLADNTYVDRVAPVFR